MKYFKLILGILIVIGGFLGATFASKLAAVRSSWQRKNEGLKKDVVEKRKKVAELEKIITNAKLELQQAIHGWERYFPAVGVNAGGRPGTLILAVGTNSGLQQDSVVYAFQPSPDGAGTVYVGPFKAVRVVEASAELVPFWRFRAGDEAAWRFGQNWRIRTNIPQQHKTKFSDYETLFLRKDELLIDQQKHLADQETAKQNAETNLQARTKELNGDPDIEKAVPRGENLDRFLIEGYHSAVAGLEELRNEVQADVDRLRREAKRAHDEIERLIAENERLAKQAEPPQRTAGASKD